MEGMSVLLDHLPNSDVDCLILFSLCQRFRLPVWHQTVNGDFHSQVVVGSPEPPPTAESRTKASEGIDGAGSYLTAKHGVMFTRRELAPSFRSRFFLAAKTATSQSVLQNTPLIGVLSHIGFPLPGSQASGCPGTSAKCGSARLAIQSERPL
jgi:hypothetical protein